ncbi:hypothetical protein CYMTET_49771 [Cymbomonas tetramitiformis]|uniref:Uncharacterized protein n=2 Tax=Cymbomonas tetramitiformis TaxID=36881 RepID=A0AAE0BR87_9CHLO|nr:hypothetical protein CYMTET_49771 [Cymbomonas tetramitiformis]
MAEQWHKVSPLLDPEEVDPLFEKLVGCNPGKLYRLRCQPINTLIKNAVIAKHAADIEKAIDSDDESASVVQASHEYTAEVVNSSTAEFEKFQLSSRVSSAVVDSAVVANRTVLSPDVPPAFERHIPKSRRNTPAKSESVQPVDASLEKVAKKLAKLQVEPPAQSSADQSARVIELESLLQAANDKFTAAEKLYESFRVESEKQLSEAVDTNAKQESRIAGLLKRLAELEAASEGLPELEESDESEGEEVSDGEESDESDESEGEDSEEHATDADDSPNL